MKKRKRVLWHFLVPPAHVAVLPATSMAAGFGSGDAEIYRKYCGQPGIFPQRKLQSLWEILSSLQKTVRIFLKWWITLPMQPWKMWKTRKENNEDTFGGGWRGGRRSFRKKSPVGMIGSVCGACYLKQETVEGRKDAETMSASAPG